jgi:predicted alpha/beta hydrolase family esterase
MPHAEAPQLHEWLPHLAEVVGRPDEQLFLVGHSLGCITILRYLESLPDASRIGGVVLVAGFAQPIHLEELNNFFAEPLDDAKVKRVAPRIIAINSDNDPHVPLWHGEKLHERFGAKLIVIKDGGHLNEGSGFIRLPAARDALLELLPK